MKEVSQQYAHATAYHVESIKESQTNGEFRREWSKRLVTSIAGPGNQYRFETRDFSGHGLQISDGKTEWICSSSLQQYIQQPASGAGPSWNPRTMTSARVQQLAEATYALKRLSAMVVSVRTATYAAEETIELNGQNIPCTVVHANGESPGHIPWRLCPSDRLVDGLLLLFQS